MYALLVGINEYANPALETLKGCANDADAMAELLRERFGVSTEHIRLLKNSEATHDAIKQAFHEHLIENARKETAAGNRQAAFFFHYSGHGSQAPDETGSEPDGLDETIVPHDSRVDDVEDIKDWELGQWLEELTGLCENVTVMMDCCHSGSVTRSIGTSKVQTRRAPADTRPQRTQRPANKPNRRSVAGASGWRHEGGYALFAGCRDGEESNEHMGWQGRSLGRHGAMSYFMINQLADMQPEQTLTYRELHRAVRQQVNITYPTQSPCCEGDIDREIFGGLRPLREVFINVVATADGTADIDAGKVHGITTGTVLHAYAPGTRTVADAEGPLATLTVTEVGASRSVCAVEADSNSVPLHAQAVIHRAAPADVRHTLALQIQDDDVIDAVRNRLDESSIAGYIKIIDDDSLPADFYVTFERNLLSILDAGGRSLVPPLPASDLDTLASDLAHVIRFQNVARLSSPPPSVTGADIGIEIKQLVTTDDNKATAKPFAVAADAELVIEEGTAVVFEITNNSARDLFFAVLNLTSEWAVDILYPQEGAREILPAGRTFKMGLDTDPEMQILASLPDGETTSREIMKVIATSADTDFELLCQGPLRTPYEELATGARSVDSALSSLFRQTMGGGQTRGTGAPDEVWSTDQLQITVQ